jgi:hypothetical protein
VLHQAFKCKRDFVLHLRRQYGRRMGGFALVVCRFVVLLSFGMCWWRRVAGTLSVVSIRGGGGEAAAAVVVPHACARRGRAAWCACGQCEASQGVCAPQRALPCPQI